MLSDVLDHEQGAELQADVIVVGSGIAGAEIACHLSRNGQTVLLLESGREAFDAKIQALNDVDFIGKAHRRLDPDTYYHRYLPPELRGVSRVRRFGGTSNVWTGKWKYLQESDFQERPWVPNSDWPISFEELLPYYRSAGRDYGFGDLEAEARRPEVDDLRRTIGQFGLKMSSFYWEETATRTAARFGDEMRSSEKLHVVLGATAVELRLDDDRRRVSEVVCRSLEGREVIARADTVVLATGALEAARLLLVSDRQLPQGIGNAHDLVGRYYTDHPKHHTGILWPGPLTRAKATELQYAPKPRFCICFALDDDTQREHQLLEHVLYLKPIYEKRRDRFARMLRGRPVCRDGNGRVANYRVKFVTEQVPQKESRVSLAAELDPLGVRKTQLDWCFTELDHRSMATTLELLVKRFAEAGIGRFDFGDDPPHIDGMTDAAHHMGTTRMAADERSGVVDTQCRVFGTNNLYVASSAVFPTGPSYSPTFTILALARRLGEHLLQRRAEAPRLRSDAAAGS